MKVVPGCLWLQDQLQETLHGVEDLELAQEVRKFIVLWLRTDDFFVGWRTGWVVKIDQTNIDLERYGKKQHNCRSFS